MIKKKTLQTLLYKLTVQTKKNFIAIYIRNKTCFETTYTYIYIHLYIYIYIYIYVSPTHQPGSLNKKTMNIFIKTAEFRTLNDFFLCPAKQLIQYSD